MEAGKPKIWKLPLSFLKLWSVDYWKSVFNGYQTTLAYMNPEKLYSIIQGLSKRQKTVFRIWINEKHANEKALPMFVLLYDRMVSCKEYEDSTIRGTEFRKAKDYNKVREVLFYKLLQGLSERDGKGDGLLSEIRVSVSLGAIEWATKKLTFEIQSAFESENYDYLSSLLLCRDIAFQNFRIELYQPDGPPKLDTIRSYFDRIYALSKAHEKSLEAFKWRSHEKIAYSESLLELLREYREPSNPDEYWVQKLKIDHLVLTDRQHEAARLQIDLVEGIMTGKYKIRNPQKVREISAGILCCLRLGYKGCFSRFHLFLANLKPDNLFEKEEKARHLALRTIAAGYAFNDPSIAKEGYERLLKIETQMDTDDFVNHLYTCCLTFAINAQWADGVTTLKTIRQRSRSSLGNLTWQPEVLRAVFAFELKEFEYLHSLSRQIKRALKNSPVKFPNLILESLSKMQASNHFESRKKLVGTLLSKIERLRYNPDERRQMAFFDLEKWLQSKIQNCSMAEVAIEQTNAGDIGFNWAGTA